MQAANLVSSAHYIDSLKGVVRYAFLSESNKDTLCAGCYCCAVDYETHD